VAIGIGFLYANRSEHLRFGDTANVHDALVTVDGWNVAEGRTDVHMSICLPDDAARIDLGAFVVTTGTGDVVPNGSDLGESDLEGCLVGTVSFPTEAEPTRVAYHSARVDWRPPTPE
jgi:hypothetical protein